jgi:transposase
VKEFGNDEFGIEEAFLWARGAKTWCMEATGRHHLKLADRAVELGSRCLVVNPGHAKKYLGFVDSRAKTDKIDALGLARLAEREGESLHSYKTVPVQIQKARDLLVERRALTEARVALEQVAEQTGTANLDEAISSMKKSVEMIGKELAATLKGYPGYEHLMTIPSIGPMSAAVLVCTLERGEFLTSDSLVAFAGLDPRPRESGKIRGKRRLSHQGDAQLRTILYMAATAGARTKHFKPYYQAQKAKGLSSTEATVILARKLIRVAWSVYKQQKPFEPLDKQT